MAILFRTTGAVPSASGAALSSGTFNGLYYAVDRTLATTTTLLTDNFASWTGLPAGVTISGNTMTIASAGGVWSPSAGNYVAIDKTIVCNGGAFTKSSGTAANVCIYFINCTIIVNTAVGWASYTLGHNAVGNDAGSQRDYGPTQTTNGGMMFWGCTFVTNKTTSTWGIAPSEMIGCSFKFGTATDQPLFGAGRGGRYINTDLSGFGDTTFRGWQMYGIPASVSGCNFFAIGFGNIGNGQAGPLLLEAPNFSYPAQTNYYQGNTSTQADQIVQIYGGVQYANTGAGWMNTAGTGFFGWGGTASTRGYAGFANYQGLGYRFQDFSNTGVRNVRLRVRSNHQITPAGATAVARLNTTTSAQQNLVQSFLTDTQGRLNYESTATDGTTFTAGYLNYLTGQISSTAPATAGVWNINSNANATPAYTPIVVGSIGRPTGPDATPTLNYVNTSIAWDARSLTNNFVLSGTKDYGNTTQTPLGTQLSDLGSTQTAAQNPNVKQAAITAMLATNNGNIDSYFLGRFTTLPNADLNDAHDAARYEFFNYALPSAPVVDSTGSVNVGSANFTLNANATGGTISTKGYTYDGVSNWTIRSPYFLSNSSNLVNGSLITSGTITLTSMATQAGSYTPMVASTIILAGSQTVYQSISATTSITNLLPSGNIAVGVTVGFGTSTAISITGNCFINNCQLSGTLSLNSSTANLSLSLINGGLTGNLTINGSGSAIQVARQNFALNGFTLTISGTASQSNSLSVNIDATSRGGRLLLLTSGGTIVANQSIPSLGDVYTFSYPTSPTVDRAIIGNANDTNAYVPRVFSSAQLTSGSIDATGLQATQSTPAPQDATSFSTSFSGGITQFSIPTSQTGSTAGVTTAARIVRRFGDQAFLQGINAALTGGFTLTQFINNNLSDTTTISTNLIQFISSDATQQRTIGGVVFSGNWYVQGGSDNKTLGITGALGVPQIGVPLNNQSASIGDVYTAEAQVIAALVTPDLVAIARGVEDASLLVPTTIPI